MSSFTSNESISLFFKEIKYTYFHVINLLITSKQTTNTNMSTHTQQIRSFIHVSDQTCACRRHLFKQRVCVPIKRHVLDASGRSASTHHKHLTSFKPVILSVSSRQHFGHQTFKCVLDTKKILCKYWLICYLEPLYPMRSMSSSGVDSMIA